MILSYAYHWFRSFCFRRPYRTWEAPAMLPGGTLVLQKFIAAPPGLWLTFDESRDPSWSSKEVGGMVVAWWLGVVAGGQDS